MAIVEVPDVRAHLHIGDDDFDAEIAEWIAGASDLVESRLGFASPVAVVETVQARNGVLVLNHLPVLSVESVTAVSTAVPVVVDPVLTLVPGGSESGVIRFSDWSGCDLVTVAYTAGRATVPAVHRSCVLLLVQWLWETRRGVGDLAAPLDSMIDADEPDLRSRAFTLMNNSRYAALPGFA